MKVNITKRDFKFFLLGVFSMFIFVLIYDWDDFEKGWKGVAPNDTTELVQL